MADEEGTHETQQRRGGPPKRKRETAKSRAANHSKSNTPNAFARRSPPREPSPIKDMEDDGDRSPPRKLKRPGAGARVSQVNRQALERERRQREEAARAKGLEGRQKAGAELIAEHYNAVPERGRDWRQAESKIAGLRSLNNWIKSTLIQKFSRPDVPVEDLKVLDMACGKGGDLGKWEKAPQVPVLYVGCDIAGVSIEQAQQRYNENLRKSRGRHRRMHAEFYVHDAFGRSLADIPTIRNVGFNPNAGPGPGVIQGGMLSGGFDVVSIMFALHYSFESQELARGLLSNVAGALKKGGRFLGVMPNSDVISANVKNLLSPQTPNGTTTPKDDASEDGEWDPEKPTEPTAALESDDEWDPEKPTQEEPAPARPATPPPNQPDLSWGNDIYSVRFPHAQPAEKTLPRDGIFRPPFGWRYHYHLEEAVEAPEFVVPWEAFRALAEEYGLELMYRKGFKEVFEDESQDPELGMLAERMRVLSRDRTAGEGRNGLLVRPAEMDAAAFYHAFCFYKM